MKITDQQLIGLPVATVSGQSIGKVVGLECDTEQHFIINYVVGASPLVTRWLGLRTSVLIIARTQVVSITAEQMEVEDNVMPVNASVVKGVVASPSATVTSPSLFK